MMDLEEQQKQQRKRETMAVHNAFKRLMDQEQERCKLNDASNSMWGDKLKKEIILDVIAVLQEEEKKAKDPTKLITNEVLKRASEATEAVKYCVGVDLVNKKHNKDTEDETKHRQVTRSYFDLKQAAFIAVQLTLDNAMSPLVSSRSISKETGDIKASHAQSSLTQLADKIGRIVQNECWYSMMHRNLPGWHKAVHEFAMKNSNSSETLNASTRYYTKAVDDAASRKAADLALSDDEDKNEKISVLSWRPWTRKQRVHVGRWLMRAVLKVAEAKGLLTTEYRLSKDEKGEFIILGINGAQFRDELLFSTLDYCWENIPMVCPPVPHIKRQIRGYLAKAAWHRPPSREGVLLLSDEHIAFVNMLQNVPYRLNPFVLKLMDFLVDREWSLGKFHPETMKVPDTVAQRLGYGSIADRDQQTEAVMNDPRLKDVMRERGQDFARNKYLVRFGNAVNTRGLMRVINTVRNEEQFWIPTFWDFRGRTYYSVPYLNPQGYDPGKGVLQFATPTPVDDWTCHYLKLSISTALGYDKLSYEDRIDKVNALIPEITNVALMFDSGDISSALSFLEQMGDDVWEGLAACEEFYWTCLAPIESRRKFTHYRCALDATAQGAQLISGFRRSRAGAAKVNVLPCDKPNDVYMNLWDALVDVVCHDGSVRSEILEVYKEEGYGRKLAKTGILMSAQYGSGITKQVDTFKEIHDGIPAQYRLTEEELALFIGHDGDKDKKIPPHRPFVIALERATSLSAYVEWMRGVTTKVFKTGKRYLAIPTLSGSVCLMRYSKKRMQRIKTFHHSSIDLSPLTSMFSHQNKTPKPDPRKWGKASSANGIHLQDSHLLSHAFHDWQFNISTIHDSIIAAPGMPMKALERRFIHAFVETISWDFWKAVYEANKLPIDSNVYEAVIGDLKVDDIKQANYLVC